jgi:spermidine/putrescine transport system ATP-binding protein
MKKTIIEARNLYKEFGKNAVVKHINFTIAENEFVTFLGPSGCGKTTILRMIAGFEIPTSGQIFLYDKVINDIPAYLRPLNMVFQNYALFPHMDVFENIAFSMRIKKQEAKAIEAKVAELLEVVNLSGYEQRDIASLSGGQQQRVAIARALANDPKVLLLDEPLSALDLKMRKEMQIELKKIQREVKKTFIYVTHDQEEALTLSDKIIVLNHGEIQQSGTPIDIYNEPINTFVADFIGESNIIDGTMTKDFEVEFLGKRFLCVDKRPSLETDRVQVVIRPEDIEIGQCLEHTINGVVTSIVFKGVHYEIIVQCSESEYDFMIHTTDYHEINKHVGLDFGPNDIHIMKAG